MKIPDDVGAEWDRFVSECCLGGLPAQSVGDIQRAFDALRRLWPEWIESLEANGNAGLLVVAPMITLGLVLADVESVPGFGPVFERYKSGESSARAELDVAAALVRSHYKPRLEPPLDGNVLDSVVEVAGRAVYFEVISPVRSTEMRAASDGLANLAGAVLSASAPNAYVEILLAPESIERRDEVLAALQMVPIDGAVHEVENVGHMLSSSDSPGILGSRIRLETERPIMACARGRFGPEGSTSVTVRVPISDERVQRLLSAELHHLSRDEPNVLVVHVTGVPGSLPGWIPLVDRWFQPNRNTRVGAVVLYEERMFSGPHALRQRWHVMENPHARVKVPEPLLRALEALDEPAP